jgi:hypothetical protein
MGMLREISSNKQSVLEHEHLIGRGRHCSLRLTKSYVSTQHAVIRWNGERWELLDRSRNGTHLNGEPLEPRKGYVLEQGAVVAFGHPREQWVLSDTSPPEVMVVDVASDVVLFGMDGVIGIPSSEDPQATVFRDEKGVWCLEHPDRSPVVLANGALFELAGRAWRFSCPESLTTTVPADYVAPTKAAALHFRVSSDEEFVELSIAYPERTIEIGCRAQNYLLLTLARARLKDRASAVPETSCGWVDKERLAEDLAITPQQVDGDVFRIRKHFGELGLSEAASIIERRHRTRQLRIGIERSVVTLV